MRTALLALCLFLFAYRANSDLIDTDGDVVRNPSAPYHLVPVSNHLSGRLGLAAVGNDTFPKTVVLHSNLNNGSSPLPESADWFLVEEFPIGWTVKVHQTTRTVSGSFSVEPAKTGYKIVYYHDHCKTRADLGIVYRDGFYCFAVKDGDPFIFKIKKATESSARIMSIV